MTGYNVYGKDGPSLGMGLGGLVVGLMFLYLAGRCEKEDLGKEIYRGSIDDKKIIYYEREPGIFVVNRKNALIVNQGSTTYTLIDRLNTTPIEEPNFNQKLEKIIVTEGKSENIYYSKDTASYNLKGRNINVLFSRSNSLYNRLRKGIKEKLDQKSNSS